MPAALFACGVNYPSQERAILPAAGTTLHNTPPYTGVPPPVRFTGGFTDVAAKKRFYLRARIPAVEPPVVVLRATNY